MLHFGALEIRTDIFVLLLSVLLLTVQLFLCFKAKKRALRLLPICLLSGLTAIFVTLALVFDGWDSVGFLFLAALCAFLLFACGIAFGIWYITNRKKH